MNSEMIFNFVLIENVTSKGESFGCGWKSKQIEREIAGTRRWEKASIMVRNEIISARMGLLRTLGKRALSASYLSGAQINSDQHGSSSGSQRRVKII